MTRRFTPTMTRVRFPAALFALALLLAAPLAHAQGGSFGASDIPPAAKLVRVSVAPVTIAAGGTAEAVLTLEVEPHWHINANPPAQDYMIPTTVDLPVSAGVQPGKPHFPGPKSLTVGFEQTPLLVYDGQTSIRVPLRVAATAANGAHVLKGKLGFQACNDQVCLAPAKVPFEIAVTVTGAVAGAGALPPGTEDDSTDVARGPPAEAESSGAALPDTARAGGTGFTTAPPPGAATSAALDNPLARLLEHGGWAAFLTLFLIGLALNLTPCVYPMIGVTVSIFGARRAAPPLQVFGYAVLYVLGMAVMYSTLGLVAAFTGGLFGGFLQSPVVLVGIGVLLVALSLSMFGVYELNVPPALLNRLGGNTATSAAGTFLSGLVVGVFAAPCVGPPVVALLAVVAAKGSPWFGFSSFFTLALGLGFPYLLLGTFSNLIQTLPRSGEWMIWVKKLFGVILLAVGLFYALLALAPKAAGWVMPAALVLGGIYLGFFEHSAAKRRGFALLKRVTGAAALVAGIVIVVTTPTHGITFREFDPKAMESTLQRGRPVMIDFSANWCVPCHELERSTFTDRRVIAAARAFDAFKVDLTHYDSPEAEGWRKRYAINGVPTVVFIVPGGAEVRGARVEGFVAADRFLERLKLASGNVAEALPR